MIETRGLTKRFGALDVLRGIDLCVAPARVTGIVGPNGAGKTTLMKIVLGLTRADTGTVLLDGAAIGDDERYRTRIGYMPQIARYPENLTAGELFTMLRDLRGDARATDDELLDTFGLRDQMSKKLRVMSGGTRQKVNAALAFFFTPDLLILDEPTAGLDPVSAGTLKDKIRRERAAGRTIIVTSHIMNELEELCDDVVFLLDGAIRFSGSVHELKTSTHQTSLERAVAVMMMKGETKTGGAAA